MLSVFLLQCSTAFAAVEFSGQWLNQLDTGTASDTFVVETTLHIEQRGKLLCGAWMSNAFFNGHISTGHVVGEVSGNSAKIIFSENLRSEDGLVSSYSPSKSSSTQHLSLKGSQLYAKYKDYGLNHQIKTFEVIYKKQTQPASVSEESWKICQKFPLTHHSSGTPKGAP